MSADLEPKADRDVIATWVEGWALCRGVAAPVRAYDGFRVEVGLPDQAARYVFAQVSSGIAQASREIAQPNVFLKVCAAPEAVRPLLATGWVVSPVGCMMTVEGLRWAASAPDDYQLKLDPAGGGYAASILAQDGGEAASGRVSIVGSTAVFDQIVTHPDHRRRGLGRAVMSALGAAALQAGASRGTLAATPEGRALYGALGWRVHAAYASAVRG